MSLKPKKDNKLNIKITLNYNFDLNIWQSSDRMLTFFLLLEFRLKSERNSFHHHNKQNTA